jgi:hypothetical protein
MDSKTAVKDRHIKWWPFSKSRDHNLMSYWLYVNHHTTIIEQPWLIRIGEAVQHYRSYHGMDGTASSVLDWEPPSRGVRNMDYKGKTNTTYLNWEPSPQREPRLKNTRFIVIGITILILILFNHTVSWDLWCQSCAYLFKVIFPGLFHILFGISLTEVAREAQPC